jgi:hypothetical protein
VGLAVVGLPVAVALSPEEAEAEEVILEAVEVQMDQKIVDMVTEVVEVHTEYLRLQIKD